MIELTIALLLQSTAPAEVACILDIKTRRRGGQQRIIEVDIGCPDDVENAEALQAVAENAASVIDGRRIRHAALMTANQAFFQQTSDGGWEVVPGQMIASIPASMPVRMMMDGYETASCSWSAQPDYRGRLRLPRITCYVDGRVRPRTAIRAADNMVEDILRNTLFLPTLVDYCFQDEIRVVSTAINVTGGRYNNDNDREPDMRPLPEFCG